MLNKLPATSIEIKSLGNGQAAYVGHSVAGAVNGTHFILTAGDPTDLIEIWDRIMGNVPVPKLEEPKLLLLNYCKATATVAESELEHAAEMWEAIIQ
jgi:hypothetical protein